MITIDAVQKRFQVFLTLVPFDMKEQPICIEDDDEYILGNIYLVDEHGGKIATVNLYETVEDALKKLSLQEWRDATFVLFLEAKKIAFIPKYEN